MTDSISAINIVAAPASDRASARDDVWLAAGIGICLMLQLALVFLQPINWDEFRFLADIHLFDRGELGVAVQTFHVHLLTWVLDVAENEVDQVTFGRLLMLALEAGSAGFIYLCTRTFVSRNGALAAGLCYLTSAFVLQHGASFRFDPLATFLLMSATTLCVHARLAVWSTSLAGVLVAVAGLVTIKSVFYVPTLLFIMWWRARDAVSVRRVLWRLFLGAAAGMAAFAALYAYHQSGIDTGTIGASQTVVAQSVDKTLGHARLLPQAATLAASLLNSPINWLLLLAGIWSVVGRLLRSPDAAARRQAMALGSLALPLLTLLFYRNAFPYYYAFMLAPASVLAGVAADRLARAPTLKVIAAALTACAIAQAIAAISPVREAQRSTLEVVHRMFPGAVAYIDRCSMVGSFRKHGFFMSTWGTEVYRDAGRPVMRDILVRERPAFVLVNSPILASALERTTADAWLLAEDAATLRTNFIPHWGPIWVAGKRIDLAATERDIEILVAGTYTIEAEAPVVLDGVNRAPGDVVDLAAGWHRAGAVGGPVRLTLRWGSNLYRPVIAPPSGPLFVGF